MTQKTLFIDIDGTIIRQDYPYLKDPPELATAVLPGIKDKIFQLYATGSIIILTTGRPEAQRQMLSDWLVQNDIYFHKLICECGNGVRYLINDVLLPYTEQERAKAINTNRNSGDWIDHPDFAK